MQGLFLCGKETLSFSTLTAYTIATLAYLLFKLFTINVKNSNTNIVYLLIYTIFDVQCYNKQ